MKLSKESFLTTIPFMNKFIFGRNDNNNNYGFFMYDLLRKNITSTIGHEIPFEEFHAFTKLFFSKSIEKKTLLTDTGERCRYLYFILKGSACSYYINDRGEKSVVQLAVENYWITDLYSFLSSDRGLYSVETIEDCEVLYLNREKYQESFDKFSFVDRYFRILTQNALVAQQYRLIKTNSENAMHRYLEFQKLYPHFNLRIPQYLIASYLGIQPQSLSRIRKKLSS